ncbi:Cytochrome P450 monooxygenase ABA1 [Fulvia fulva]|nr:Cytochrome P450 monooxygenase ABA1 [Fulvia fulva]KAK4614991.1 Cytochrome P450 monooxygenase ABA1 [Fulvia fulva]WPV20171.1 Cytochrome P450 monooxygenase ABA1 [Fulvia fulva]WPV35556.1 Cytochrome P450 monooxygenase ABA1 [Fulvia fulva]
MSKLLLSAVVLPLGMSLTTVVPVLAIIAYALWSYLSYRRLSHIPGPTLSHWSIIPQLSWILSGNSFPNYGQICFHYGPLVRIAPDHVLTSNPEIIRKISAARSPYTRSHGGIVFRSKAGVDNILSTRDDKVHNEKRQQMAAGYSGKENLDMESDMDVQVEEFVKLIEEKYVSDKDAFRPVDLSAKASFFTMDVISALAFGKTFGCLKEDRDVSGIMEQTKKAVTLLSVLIEVPWVYRVMEQGMRLQGIFGGSDAGVLQSVSLAKEAVEERLVEMGLKGGGAAVPVDKQDMLGSFIRRGLPVDQLETEALLQVLAGAETTAVALRMVLLHLASNSHAQRKLVQEIEQSGWVEGVISDKQAREMPYLQACIKESLRLQPPVSFLNSKVVPKGGDELDGYFVPEGTKVGWSTFAIQRSPVTFAPDPDIFRPERWILVSAGGDCESSDTLAHMSRTDDLVFGWGRWKCLGQNVALMELNKLVAEFSKRFEWSLCDPAKAFEVDFNVAAFVQTGMWMRVTAREM